VRRAASLVTPIASAGVVGKPSCVKMAAPHTTRRACVVVKLPLKIKLPTYTVIYIVDIIYIIIFTVIDYLSTVIYCASVISPI
jgi:hypothetical protein